MSTATAEQLYTIEEVGVRQSETGTVVYHGYNRHGVPLPCFTANQIAERVAGILNKGIGYGAIVVRRIGEDETT